MKPIPKEERPELVTPTAQVNPNTCSDSITEPACLDKRKTIATLQAQAALAGCSLHELADGSFLIGRWNLTRPCRDLDEVAAFLHRMAT